jgi:hypothetical protein
VTGHEVTIGTIVHARYEELMLCHLAFISACKGKKNPAHFSNEREVFLVISLPILFIVPVTAAGATGSAALGDSALEGITIDAIGKQVLTLVDSHCHHLWLYIFLFHIPSFLGRFAQNYKKINSKNCKNFASLHYSRPLSRGSKYNFLIQFFYNFEHSDHNITLLQLSFHS